MKIKLFSLIFILFTAQSTFAQNSLWSDIKDKAGELSSKVDSFNLDSTTATLTKRADSAFVTTGKYVDTLAAVADKKIGEGTAVVAKNADGWWQSVKYYVYGVLVVLLIAGILYLIVEFEAFWAIELVWTAVVWFFGLLWSLILWVLGKKRKNTQTHQPRNRSTTTGNSGGNNYGYDDGDSDDGGDD